MKAIPLSFIHDWFGNLSHTTVGAGQSQVLANFCGRESGQLDVTLQARSLYRWSGGFGQVMLLSVYIRILLNIGVDSCPSLGLYLA